jgi:Flp pilus assembly protein TadG
MRVREHERGNALAEFALLSTFAILAIFGVIEAARALYTYHLVSNAARLGTRYAIVHGSTCSVTLPSCTAASSDDIQAYVRSVSPGIDPDALSVVTTWQQAPACSSPSPYQGAGCIVTVTASYSFSSVVPLLGLSGIPMRSQSVMVISQ